MDKWKLLLSKKSKWFWVSCWGCVRLTLELFFIYFLYPRFFQWNYLSLTFQQSRVLSVEDEMANDAKSLRNFAVRRTAIVGNFSSKLIFGHSMVRFLQLGQNKRCGRTGRKTNGSTLNFQLLPLLETSSRKLIEWRITEVTISYQYFRIKVLQPKDKFNAEVENKF